MGIPVDELQARVSSYRFAEYYADYLLEPWGTEREDYRFGIVAATVANANRDPKKKPRPFTPDQFVLRVEAPERDDDEELDDEAAEHAARVDELMAGFGDEATTESFMVRKADTETLA